VNKNDYFAYKGDRDYLHGTSVFDLLINEYIGPEQPEQIDFIFAKSTPCICTVSKDKQPESTLVASYVDSNNRFFMYETHERISNRVKYTEPEEGHTFEIHGSEASITTNSGYSFIEALTGAYKCLLTRLFPDIPKKFVLARLILDYLPATSCTIRYKRKISDRFYEAVIYENDTEIGHIYFGEK